MLAAKKLPSGLKQVIYLVISAVNFLKPNALITKRNLNQLHFEMKAEPTQLSLHKEVNWLSMGKVMKRVDDMA
jgi:hypothetical protein